MSQSQIGSFFSVQKRKAGHEVTKAGKEVGSGVEKMKGSAKNREFDLTTSAGLKRKLDSLKCDKKVAASSSKAVIKDLSGSKPREEEKRKEKGGAPSSSSLSPPCEKRAKLSSVNARLLEAIQAGEKRKQQQLKKKDKAKEELEQKPVDKEVVPCSPKLSKSDFVLSLSVPQSPVKKVFGIPPSPTKPKVTPVKASPRKFRTVEKYQALSKHCDEAELPLPYKYRFLLEVFRSLEQVVSMRFNRQETIRVKDLKSAVQTAMKRNFQESFLKQIRCVFPQAYRYVWEHEKSRFGEDKRDYELHITPNLRYKEDLEDGRQTTDDRFYSGKAFIKINAKELVLRRNIFKGILYNMLHDQHRSFLRTLIPPITEVPDLSITRWHADFDLESVNDVDTTEFPTKPDVIKLHTAKDVFTASRNLFGVNKRLDNVLKEAAEKQKAKEEVKEEAEPPVNMKGLEGLPPALVKKILEKEKAKQLKKMTETPGDKKEVLMLEDLQTFGPLVVNCLNSEKQRQARSAVALAPFVKFVSDSYGKKSVRDTEELVRLLAKLAPEFIQTLILRKVEYIKFKNGATPSNNALRDKLKKLLEDKRKV